jgi:uncharacterized protein (TIGR02594 family)
MTEPFWLQKAKSYLGTFEVHGPKTSPTILKWWQRIGASFRDDETPWCAAFVGGVLEESGIKSTKSAAARSYLKWGTQLPRPALGAIAVFWRGTPIAKSGHVGFLVGRDEKGNLLVLGGNQGDAVTIKPFAKDRLLAYTWPTLYKLPDMGDMYLPLISASLPLSTNEA